MNITLTMADVIITLLIGVVATLLSVPLLKVLPIISRNVADWWARTSLRRAEKRARKLEKELEQYRSDIQEGAIVRVALRDITMGLVGLVMVTIYVSFSVIGFLPILPFLTAAVIAHPGEPHPSQYLDADLRFVLRFLGYIYLPMLIVLVIYSLGFVGKGMNYLRVEMRLERLQKSLEKMQLRILMS